MLCLITPENQLKKQKIKSENQKKTQSKFLIFFKKYSSHLTSDSHRGYKYVN